MTNVKLYCQACLRCANFGKEKAPIRSRGFLGVSWGTRNRVTEYSSILTLHAKARKAFYMEYNG